MNDGMKQQTYRVDENMALLALDLFARIIAMRIDAGPPFSALFTLWLSMMAAESNAWVTARTLYILSTGCQWRYLPKDFPPYSTVHHYFVWWQCDGVLDRIHHALYVECREKAEREVHHPVHDGAHVGTSLATAGFRRRNQRFHIRPFVFCQVARIPQMITIVFRSVLMRPHWRSLRESDHLL
jgi:hypothetical protein